MSTTNLVTLAVALIALIGTVISAILGPLYAQRARREDRLQVLADRREDRLRSARDRFQDDCDHLQVRFASVVAPVFSYRNPHEALDDDLLSYADTGFARTQEDRPASEEELWYAVQTALKAVERSSRKVAQESQELGRRAGVVHESLREEVNLVRRASIAPGDRRRDLHDQWSETRARSDQLRKEFDAAASRI
ncbi:hypothetical protein FHS41_008252 [Streptomyces violarus]|uniref:Uncharacterized protein n=1 Tax=Streptomyces violarus TaxID=67380 RepID=A0A7W5F6M9_9ACTN|nr:hypothetical protein [Streptomyces violarus]MBB3081694.1 hypothetical protein [Streptomyces violarus]